jgi:hypothetical protein
MRERLEQAFGLYEVGRLKTLDEPGIDWGKNVPCLVIAALTGIEVAEPKRGSEFRGSCALIAGRRQRSMEPAFGSFVGWVER